MSRRARRLRRAGPRTPAAAGSAAAGVMLAGFALAAPAQAMPRVHGARLAAAYAVPRSPLSAPRGAPYAPQDVPRIAPRDQASKNWSGYAVGGGTYTSVSAGWVEPSGICGSGDRYSSFWVGLDGYTSQRVEQTGSEFDCSGGTPRYYSWYEMYPADPVNFRDTVRPGDRFTASVTYTGSGNFTLKLADTTAGWSHTVRQRAQDPALSSAEVIAEAPCCTASGQPLPLADFGTVTFTGATADGSPIGTARPTGIDLVSSGGITEDSVSPLAGGSIFSVIWKSSGPAAGMGGRAQPGASYAGGPAGHPGTPRLAGGTGGRQREHR
ncbi:MAG TPA: G1 family glutamic endopeptidase [Streptosporangiaceae bacterium]|nr:G1 family glutamic endopeptidase [Streptosporangiaceae bacterium]